MSENWDSFPVNIAETEGPIKQTSFTFDYTRFEVWQGGSCIDSGNSKGQIVATWAGGNLFVEINDPAVNDHIVTQPFFSEISTTNDRVMWSKDIFNKTGRTRRNDPDLSSLFFKDGVLKKVTYTIHDPNTLVEFYS